MPPVSPRRGRPRTGVNAETWSQGCRTRDAGTDTGGPRVRAPERCRGSRMRQAVRQARIRREAFHRARRIDDGSRTHACISDPRVAKPRAERAARVGRFGVPMATDSGEQDRCVQHRPDTTAGVDGFARPDDPPPSPASDGQPRAGVQETPGAGARAYCHGHATWCDRIASNAWYRLIATRHAPSLCLPRFACVQASRPRCVFQGSGRAVPHAAAGPTVSGSSARNARSWRASCHHASRDEAPARPSDRRGFASGDARPRFPARVRRSGRRARSRAGRMASRIPGGATHVAPRRGGAAAAAQSPRGTRRRLAVGAHRNVGAGRLLGRRRAAREATPRRRRPRAHARGPVRRIGAAVRVSARRTRRDHAREHGVARVCGRKRGAVARRTRGRHVRVGSHRGRRPATALSGAVRARAPIGATGHRSVPLRCAG